ncbi:YdeI/OmpD-associated family protein [Foetidibacter luteolus]|uniref:YdeI/OmpD-associated family protein n=1 Tax=Foetidibacter luteolus TaxID=2608880 RepID=UPI00129B8B28|nr:YdeI/OmpD-associated family protein [Foetidibacter luteolus]
MIKFTATIEQFKENADKTGWTYITIPVDVAQKLNPGNKKIFRIKGKLDSYNISGKSLLPMGDGSYILALNEAVRKGIKKRKGATLQVQLEKDEAPVEFCAELMECLEDEPVAKEYFNSLTKSHRKYFSDWIMSAKTEPTKTKRIAQAINAMQKKFDFGQMLRSLRDERRELNG